jgi:hypothetical protein
VAKPRIRLDRNLVCELLLSNFRVNSSSDYKTCPAIGRWRTRCDRIGTPQVSQKGTLRLIFSSHLEAKFMFPFNSACSNHFHKDFCSILVQESVSRWAGNLTTKFITLWELFSFISKFSRLQYEWSSDCWCVWKSLGVNACLQWRKYFHFIG